MYKLPVADHAYHTIHKQYEQRTVSAADDPIMAPFIGVKIHTGYSLYVQQILAQIKSNITAYSPERIIVTGHSLGGGVYVLCA